MKTILKYLLILVLFIILYQFFDFLHIYFGKRSAIASEGTMFRNIAFSIVVIYHLLKVKIYWGYFKKKFLEKE